MPPNNSRALMDFCLSFILDFDNQAKAYNCLILGDKTRQDKTRDPWKEKAIKTMESYTGSPKTSLNKKWSVRFVSVKKSTFVLN